MMAMPYWLSVGMPSKKTELVIVQAADGEATVKTEFEAQPLSDSTALSNTLSVAEQVVAAPNGLT